MNGDHDDQSERGVFLGKSDAEYRTITMPPILLTTNSLAGDHLTMATPHETILASKATTSSAVASSGLISAVESSGKS